MAVVMFASIVAISIGTNMKADAQNPTTSEEAASQMTSMTNMTGLSSSTGENDPPGEVEEGSGEDEDEPGDIDQNDKEDQSITDIHNKQKIY